MILSGTSATENVYNEFMYVNNAWELIGTSATDLTNYYTKAEVDGKLLLKANASDLTSHTGDTTIHVTASDKTKWTNSANTVVLRLAKTALTPSSSTNAFSNLDDSTALKVGDKVMDTAGVLFSITAIDTQNSTFTIGTALIDLAQDSDVVHKSGNETIAGAKTFTDSIQLKSNVAEFGVTGGNSQFYLIDKNNVSLSKITQGAFDNGISYITLQLYGRDSNNQTVTNTIRYQYASNFDYSYLLPTDNSVQLGSTGNRWSKVYARNYYYGNDNVEFSTKFVTTDTAQTISGNKTFSSDLDISNADTSATTPSLRFRNSKVARGSTNETGGQVLVFRDKSGLSLCSVESRVLSDGGTALRLYSSNTDSNKQTITSCIDLKKYSDGSVYFVPDTDNDILLGNPVKRWKDVQTCKVNNLEPSSLSLPSGKNTRIDISSYFTNLGNGDTNSYSVSANGYIYMQLKDIATVHCFNSESSSTTVADYIQTFSRGNDGQLYVLFPVKKDHVFKSTWYTNTTVTITGAYFIPCQGNV